MTMISFVILVVLLMILALIYIVLASMPGKTARERGHPQSDAISFLGWIGLLLGIAPWLFAMVWARTQPLVAPAGPAAPNTTSTSTGSDDDQKAS